MRRMIVPMLALVIGCTSETPTAPPLVQPGAPANFSLTQAAQSGGTWNASGDAATVVASLTAQQARVSTIAQAIIQREIDAINAAVSNAAPGTHVYAIPCSGAVILDANGKVHSGYEQCPISTQ